MSINEHHTENSSGLTTGNMVSVINRLMFIIVVLVIGLVSVPFILLFSGGKETGLANLQSTNAPSGSSGNQRAMADKTPSYWQPADIAVIQDQALKKEIEYGKELVSHTARYLGPSGSVMHSTNGMNCQNCHLGAGTAVFGNNYGSVASMYPKFRARSGAVEDINKRVNDCFERSLNGKALDSGSRELMAIRKYIEYIGSNVPKGEKAPGSGFKDLSYLDRAADPVHGKQVYQARCASCHQADGQGVAAGGEYAFPPLWGAHSYNDGAGLYRISNLAKYVKCNMPQGTNFENPVLSDEEAWDIAAFINSQPRPHKETPRDWPDISKKPIDHPFGPYTDGFSEKQHKYGPFKPIVAAQK
jgi:thiosulfate dehydrogenase